MYKTLGATCMLYVQTVLHMESSQMKQPHAQQGCNMHNSRVCAYASEVVHVYVLIAQQLIRCTEHIGTCSALADVRMLGMPACPASGRSCHDSPVVFVHANISHA